MGFGHARINWGRVGFFLPRQKLKFLAPPKPAALTAAFAAHVFAASLSAFRQRSGRLQIPPILFASSPSPRNNYSRGPAELAERVGFEPTRTLRLYRFSRPAVSTTHTPLRESSYYTKFTRSACLYAPFRHSCRRTRVSNCAGSAFRADEIYIQSAAGFIL